jgi:hypothetical protein
MNFNFKKNQHTSSNSDDAAFFTHTRLIFILSRLLCSPLEALYYIMPFIFAKDLNATPMQIALLISVKPVVALLSFYGNLFI